MSTNYKLSDKEQIKASLFILIFLIMFLISGYSYYYNKPKPNLFYLDNTKPKPDKIFCFGDTRCFVKRPYEHCFPNKSLSSKLLY